MDLVYKLIYYFSILIFVNSIAHAQEIENRFFKPFKKSYEKIHFIKFDSLSEDEKLRDQKRLEEIIDFAELTTDAEFTKENGTNNPGSKFKKLQVEHESKQPYSTYTFKVEDLNESNAQEKINEVYKYNSLVVGCRPHFKLKSILCIRPQLVQKYSNYKVGKNQNIFNQVIDTKPVFPQIDKNLSERYKLIPICSVICLKNKSKKVISFDELSKRHSFSYDSFCSLDFTLNQISEDEIELSYKKFDYKTKLNHFRIEKGELNYDENIVKEYQPEKSIQQNNETTIHLPAQLKDQNLKLTCMKVPVLKDNGVSVDSDTRVKVINQAFRPDGKEKIKQTEEKRVVK